jgi:hypothetical protein
MLIVLGVFGYNATGPTRVETAQERLAIQTVQLRIMWMPSLAESFFDW